MFKLMGVFVMVVAVLQTPCVVANSLDSIVFNYPLVTQFVVSLKSKNYLGKYRHFCTGSILGERWVLTAGHCFSKRVYSPVSNLAVDVGSENLHDGTRYQVAAFHIHPNQSESILIYRNDLALVQLQNSIQFSNYVGPAHLGTVNDQDEVEVLTGGWGQEYNKRSIPEKIRYLLMNTMEYHKCQEMHRPRNNLVEKEMQICGFGGVGRTICFGDSGSPLVDVKTGYQVGVFSSLEDCSGNYPSLFIRIAPYIGWINKVTQLRLTLN